MELDRPDRRPARWVVLGASVVLLLLLLPAVSAGGAGALYTGRPGPSGLLTPLGSGCPGATIAVPYEGVLVNDGGPSPGPPVDGQQVGVSYQYTDVFHADNGSLSTSCVPSIRWAITNASGAFELRATIPTSGCTAHVGCWNYTGPFGPVRWSLANNSTLSGDYLAWNITGDLVTLSRVAALDRVQLDPAGATTVSALAPIAIVAQPLAGDGQPSPSDVSFAWGLSGVGWQVVGPATGPSVEVEAAEGASVATVQVWVNGTYNGTAVRAPPATVLLTAASTEVESGGVDPASVDIGSPATFTISGTGAAGYLYLAVVDPGLGMDPAYASCNSTPLSGGLVGLTCTAVVTYEGPGIAQPMANLSNGYSYALWSFPPVTVSPSLDVVATPDPVVAYPGVSVGFTVSVASGTGTAPFGPACLRTGDGGLLCRRSAGPSWTFPYAYATPGAYEAGLSVVDAGGTNDTALLPVSIVERPGAAALSLSSSSVMVGTAIEATCVVSGGALPLSYWWNLSTPAATVGAGTLPMDGAVGLSTIATSIGPSVLTLTVVDALGTRVSREANLTVTPDAATMIVAVGAPNVSAVAGVPVAFTFEALDPMGLKVADFAGPVAVSVNGTEAATLWVNSSVTGPVSRSANGTYPLDAAAWREGYLNLTVAESRSGPLHVALAPSAGLAGPPPIAVLVGPDDRHLDLLDPQSIHPGARTNATVYRICDRFGNALAGGFVVVRSVFGSTVTIIDSPVHAADGVSFVWVNYSASGSGAGTVYVLSEYGQALLGPIEVPAPTSGSDLTLPVLVAAVGIAVILGATGAWFYGRRRRRGPEGTEGPGVAPAPEGPEAPGTDEGAEIEEELKRLAEGRAHVLSHTPVDRPADLDEIGQGWTGRPPDMAELAEWVGSLVSEGLLHASVGPDGRPRFVRAEPPLRSPPPRLELDESALAAALSRRDIEEKGDATRGAEEDGPPDDPGPGPA
jgi:hypothetical protein